MTIYLDPPLLTVSSNLPESRLERLPRLPEGSGILLGLAPDGACHAAIVTNHAVSSYLAISPLPLAGRFAFCCAIRRIAAPGRYPASCLVVPGLSSPACAEAVIRRPHPNVVKIRHSEVTGNSPFSAIFAIFQFFQPHKSPTSPGNSKFRESS